MSAIKLMCDYDCYPLWHHESDDVGVINPDELGLPEQLVKDLLAWADAYDDTLNMSDPIKSGFASQAAHEAFVEQGLALAQQLKQALPDRRIVYFNDIDASLTEI